jgi:hypothetical protein
MGRMIDRSYKGDILETARQVGGKPEKEYILYTHIGEQVWYN